MRYEDLPRDEKSEEILIERVEFPIEYRLLTPLQVAGSEVSEIGLKEPTVSDLQLSRSVKGDGIPQTLRIISLLADPTLAEDDVKRMATRDFNRISEVLGSFL